MKAHNQMKLQQEVDNDRRSYTTYYKRSGLPYICSRLVAMRQDKDQRELIQSRHQQQYYTKEDRK